MRHMLEVLLCHNNHNFSSTQWNDECNSVHICCSSGELCDVFIKVKPQFSSVFQLRLFPAQTRGGFPPEESAPCWFHCYNIWPEGSFSTNRTGKNVSEYRDEAAPVTDFKTSLLWKEKKKKAEERKKQKSSISKFPLGFTAVFWFWRLKKHFGNVFGCKIIDNVFQKLSKKKI